MEGMWRLIERRNALETIRRVNEDLLRSNRDLEQFAYVASHDLQEPLRMVNSFVGLLKDRCEGKLDEQSREFMHYILEGSQRMQELILDLLAYSRVATSPAQAAMVDMEELLGEVLVALGWSISQAGARVSHDPLPTVQGNRTQLAQLLQETCWPTPSSSAESVRRRFTSASVLRMAHGSSTFATTASASIRVSMNAYFSSFSGCTRTALIPARASG